MFESWFPQDKTTLRKLLWFRTAWEKSGKPPVPTDPLNTFVGSIVRFFSHRALPIVNLSANFTPIQDLNGYDAPYPPGGGKNKCAPWVTTQTLRGVTWTANADGTFTSANAAVDNPSQVVSNNFVLPVGEYIINGCPSGGSSSTYFLRILRYDGSTLLGDASDYGAGRTFTIDGTETHCKVFVSVNTGVTAPSGTWKPMIRLSSVTDDTFAPYSNICPISGHTGCDVVRTGKNLLNLVESEMISSGWNRAFPISVKEGTYIISCQNDFGASTALGANVAFADDSNTVIKGLTVGYNFGQNNYRVGIAATITAEEASRIKRILFQLRAGQTSYADIAQGNLQLELGSTASDYEAFQGTTVAISFGSTVYGCQLTVFEDGSGKVVADRAKHIVSENDATALFQSGTNANRVGIRVPDSQLSPTVDDRLKIISNIAKASTDILTASTQKVGDCCMYSGGTETYSTAIFGVPNTATTASVAKAWLVEQGCEFIYFLATPVTIPLTASQINTLVGENNVWVNDATGDITVQAYGTEIT